jgi:hypothetical protein
MTARQRSVSPQLRALGPDVRVLAVVIDVLISTGCETFKEAWEHRLVQTAILCESDSREGWNEDHAARLLESRGWHNADGIYNAAGIPEKHRRVIDLALWQGDQPDQKRRGYFSLQEIADLTGHPLRTVQLWLHDDMPKLRRLDWEDVA